MTRIGPRVGLTLFLAALAGCQSTEAGRAEQPVSAAAAIPLSIRTSDAVRVFRVEVARTPEQQARGLMNRKSLGPDAGMLFLFDPPQRASFWMKDTYIPLDMLFVRADGTIARIAANTVPHSLELVDAGEPVGAVLEIAGGRASLLGIREGDRISWSGGPG